MRPAALLLTGILLAACSTAPGGADPNPNAPGSGACQAVPLSAKDLEAGFLGGPLATAGDGVIVEAVLAIGGNGPLLAGRNIAYAYALPALAVSAGDGGLVGVEAAIPSAAGSEQCAGTIRIALPAPGGFKGRGWFVADLAGMQVEEAGHECTTLDGEGVVGMECPLVGVHREGQASSGTLWLRVGGLDKIETVDELPAWVMALADSEPMPTDSPSAVSGTVTVDGGEPMPVLDGGSVSMRSDLGVRRYEASLPFGENGSRVIVSVPGYDGPGPSPGGVDLELEYFGDGAWRIAYYSSPCQVEIGEGGLTGSTSCTITTDYAGEPLDAPIAVEAAWSTDAVVNLVGDAVRVTWRLAGGIVTEGVATVDRSLGPGPDPGIFLLPEVPLSTGPSPAVLRLRILGYTGDGSYSGDAVDPAIDIFGDSPLLARPNPDPEAQPWTPIFGACTATARDGGERGTMSCPGNPSYPTDDPLGGSVTLFATWEPA